ncbi:TPA_asm: hypothetical protein GEJ80_14760 [Listeria monocytogenes]|nr:hypothetical protein [Listeria monocytogenes]
MNRAEKKQKQQLLLQLSDCYEKHDALHVKHEAGTYLQCATCMRGPKRLREICIDKDYKFP